MNELIYFYINLIEFSKLKVRYNDLVLELLGIFFVLLLFSILVLS